MQSTTPFDFTAAMRELMTDMAATCDELRHVDMSRVAVCFSQARHRGLEGVYATIRPLRFPGGSRTTVRHGHTYEMPRVVVGGQEALYVIAFSLPRFLDLPFEEKVSTVIHEMFHISPALDGDVRRFEGGRPYHSGSKRCYEAAMARMAQDYLRRTARPEFHAFLRKSFKELADAHGRIIGLRIRSIHPRRVQ